MSELRNPPARHAPTRVTTGGLTLVAVLGAMLPTAAAAQDWRTTTALRQVGDESALEVEIGYGAGRFEIEPAEGNTLYRAQLRYNADHFEPTFEYRTGHLQLDMEGLDDLDIDMDEDDAEQARLALALTRSVPLDLDLRFGATQADMEFGGMRIRRLDLSTGASETKVRFSQPNPLRMEHIRLEVGAADFQMVGIGNANVQEVTLDGGVADIRLDFTGEWRGNTELDVDMGLGSLTLVLPRDVGLRLDKDGLLASIDGARMEKRGDTYYSDNWDDATHRLTAEISAAFGDITVEWTD